MDQTEGMRGELRAMRNQELEAQLAQANELIVRALNTFEMCEKLNDMVFQITGDEEEHGEMQEVYQIAAAQIKDYLVQYKVPVDIIEMEDEEE